MAEELGAGRKRRPIDYAVLSSGGYGGLGFDAHDLGDDDGKRLKPAAEVECCAAAHAPRPLPAPQEWNVRVPADIELNEASAVAVRILSAIASPLANALLAVDPPEGSHDDNGEPLPALRSILARATLGRYERVTHFARELRALLAATYAAFGELASGSASRAAFKLDIQLEAALALLPLRLKAGLALHADYFTQVPAADGADGGGAEEADGARATARAASDAAADAAADALADDEFGVRRSSRAAPRKAVPASTWELVAAQLAAAGAARERRARDLRASEGTRAEAWALAALPAADIAAAEHSAELGASYLGLALTWAHLPHMPNAAAAGWAALGVVAAADGGGGGGGGGGGVVPSYSATVLALALPRVSSLWCRIHGPLLVLAAPSAAHERASDDVAAAIQGGSAAAASAAAAAASSAALELYTQTCERLCGWLAAWRVRELVALKRRAEGDDDDDDESGDGGAAAPPPPPPLARLTVCAGSYEWLTGEGGARASRALHRLLDAGAAARAQPQPPPAGGAVALACARAYDRLSACERAHVLHLLLQAAMDADAERAGGQRGVLADALAESARAEETGFEQLGTEPLCATSLVLARPCDGCVFRVPAFAPHCAGHRPLGAEQRSAFATATKAAAAARAARAEEEGDEAEDEAGRAADPPPPSPATPAAPAAPALAAAAAAASAAAAVPASPLDMITEIVTETARRSSGRERQTVLPAAPTPGAHPPSLPGLKKPPAAKAQHDAAAADAVPPLALSTSERLDAAALRALIAQLSALPSKGMGRAERDALLGRLAECAQLQEARAPQAQRERRLARERLYADALALGVVKLEGV